MIGVLAARGTLRVPASCVRAYVMRRQLAARDWIGAWGPILAPRRGGRRLLAWADLDRDAARNTLLLLGQVRAQGYRWHLSFPAAPGIVLARSQLSGNHEAKPPCLTSRPRPPALAGFATAAQWQATVGGHRRKG